MESMEIDDSLYSRQRYVLGDDAMRRMAASRVFLHGVGGVGIEIAKNLCLAGVKGLTIQDDRIATAEDLGTQFFVRPEDIKLGKSRSEACLGRLSELNPYVKVERVGGDLCEMDDLSVLEEFQCVILTDYTLDLLTRCDRFCRERQIRLIACDVFGVFGCLFCDFGPCHEVRDPNGEEPKRVMIGHISQASPGVVKTLDQTLHDLESGDVVTFKEVKGMTELNNTQHTITVLSPKSFSIGDTSSLTPYENGGLAVEVKVPRNISHRSFEEELQSPTMDAPDLGRLMAPAELHAVHVSLLHSWLRTAVSKEEFLRHSDPPPPDAIAGADPALLSLLLSTAAGGARLAPLCAFFGGCAAQEALKAVTGKFSPLRQWLYLDARDLAPAGTGGIEGRYAAARRCLGPELMARVAGLRLLLVGCGAIGCELVKNLALLGAGSASAGGEMVMTDHDLIEKSNLNRQFLFRERHIRHHKSTVAAQAALDINPDLRVRALTDKVCAATESTIFTDAFLASRHICLNALDNLATRLYMDSRCVAAQRPLLESGTMGTKGHVQVIVPHLTETYATQADPPEREVPYCTLKSFPANIEHCIQWARDKFESQFVQKPQLLAKFVAAERLKGAAQLRLIGARVAAGEQVEGGVQVSRYLRSKCLTWVECVRGARVKFNKYFNHKALQLLHSYPLDSRFNDGSLFWQSPKRPPTPLVFDPTDETHLAFVRSCARLLADAGGVPYAASDLTPDALCRALDGFSPRPFLPSRKYIETDESVSRKAAEQRRMTVEPESHASLDAESEAAAVFEALAARAEAEPCPALWIARPLPFEKDDDENGHVDFVTAASNLRAAMYSLESADRFHVKRIAGRIVPAIATTTAAVAGLVTVELLRLIAGQPMRDEPAASGAPPTQDKVERYRNAFMNLALPVLLLSEPGLCERNPLPGGLFHTVWDRWELHLPATATVSAFLQAIESRFEIRPATVMQGSKLVYLPFLPNHNKRLKQPITEFLRMTPEKSYVDLLVTTEKDFEDGDKVVAGSNDEDDEDEEQTISCPTVRLHVTQA